MPATNTQPERSEAAILDSLWLWGPFAATALAAGAGYGLTVGTGALGLAVVVGALLVPALVVGVARLTGRSLFGIDRTDEAAYVAGVLVALAVWSVAVGTWSWPLAASTAAAVAGGIAWWLAWGPGQRVAMLADFGGVVVALLALAGLNPMADPAPWRWLAAGAGATALGAVPYWMHRRVKVDNLPAVLESIERLVAALSKHMHSTVEVLPDSINVGRHGRYGVTLRLTNGKTAADVLAVIVRVESELGLREGAIVAAGQRARRNEVTVTVTPIEPDSSQLERPPLPTSIVQPAGLGRYDSGDVMWVSIYDKDNGARNGVAGGQIGSGKSRSLWTLLKSWTHCDDVLFLFGDFSGGATSTPWLPCLYRRTTDPADMQTMLAALIAAAKWRASQLPLRGWESWQPSHDDPAIILMVDEAQALLKSNWGGQQQVEDLVQISRKSGISVFMMQPNPVQMEGISPTIREQAKIRLCFASAGVAVKWVLNGTRALASAFAVLEFTKPGQVLGAGPGIEPVPGRGFDTPLAEAKADGVQHADRRPVLDAGTAEAMNAVMLAAEISREKAAANREKRSPVLPTVPADDYRLPQHELGDRSGAAAPAERWTEADSQAAAAAATKDDEGDEDEMDDETLRAGLADLANADTLFGRELPAIPDVPDVSGQMSPAQTLRVAEALLRQPDGAAPADIVKVTGRSRAAVNRLLDSWREQGLAENHTYGRWRFAVSVTRSGQDEGH